MPDRPNTLRRFDSTTTTLLGVVMPLVLIGVVLLLVALLPDDGWTLTWSERSKIVVNPWAR
jgi:hypothetical protein